MARRRHKSKAASPSRLDHHVIFQLIDQGHTQGEVSRQLHCSQGYISRLLKTRRAQQEPPPVNGDTPTTRKIPLDDICMDAGTQMRAQPLLTTIADYAEAMSDGAKFPPIILYSDGDTYWLTDGFQRAEASRQVGDVEIEAEVRPGTLRDAILFACGANATHGERRTNADKRKSVLTLLKDIEWSQFSDRRIAEICGVTHPFVAEIRHPKRPEARQSFTEVVTVTTSRNDTDEHHTPPSVSQRATREPGTHPERGPSLQGPDLSFVGTVEPPSHELPFVAPGLTVRTTTLALCPRCERVRPLMTEALAQVEHLGEAANINGYAEYQDLHATLRALQGAVTGREVPADA